MKSQTVAELKQLQAEMEEYARYLKEETYNPYTKVLEFSNRLESILKQLI